MAAVDADRLLDGLDPDQRLAVTTPGQPLAILGEAAHPAILGKERHPQKLFLPLHLHGYGRLGFMHLLGRPGEAAGVGNGQEGLQQIDIKIGDHGIPRIINVRDEYHKIHSLD